MLAKKLFAILVVGQITIIATMADNYNTDSLIQLLNREKKIEQQLKYHKEIAYIFRKENKDTTLYYLSQAEKLAKQLNDEKSLIDVIYERGVFYYKKKDKDSAKILIDSVFNFATKINYNERLSSIINTLGLWKYRAYKYDESLVLFNRALSVLEDAPNHETEAMVYHNLGMLYKKLFDFDKSLECYHKSLKLSEDSQNERGMGVTLSNIGLLYEKQHKPELALEYLERSLQIRQNRNDKRGESYTLHNIALVYEGLKNYEKALEVYQQSLKIKEELNDRKGIAKCYSNMGIVMAGLNEHNKALNYYYKALDLRKKINDERGMAFTLVNMARLHEVNSNCIKAIKFYTKAYNLAVELDDLEIIHRIYKGFSDCYELMGETDSALSYLKKYYIINDSIVNLATKQNIQALEFQYQSLKKQKENETLIHENTIKEEKLRQQLLIGIILIVLFALVLLFAILLLRGKQKRNKTFNLVLSQRNSIQKQSVKLKEAYKILQEFADFKEELSNMIIHDLKNPLNVILNVSKMDKYPEKEQVIMHSGKQMMNLIENILDVYKYQETTFKINKSKTWLNSMLHKIRSDLEFLMAEKSIKYRINVEYDFLMEIDKLAILRVLINLLNNAIKFTPNGEVLELKTIKLPNNKVRIEIIDKGEGIEQKNIDIIFSKFQQIEKKSLGYSSSTGIGLTYCKMAVEAHNGTIGVTSELGKGSVFWIELDYLESDFAAGFESEINNLIFSISEENYNYVYPYLLILREKDIFQVTEIRRVIKLIRKDNTELKKFCKILEECVLNCNQEVYDNLVNLDLNK